MPATKIESIYVRFLGNAASYMVAAAAVQKSLAGIAGQAKATTLAMTAVRSVMASGLVGAASLVAFAKMDKAMTQSLAIMGDVSDMMRNEMQQAAIDLSLSTSLSMDKLAEGYFFLASAGFTAEQSLAALDEVNRFAVAGNFDMARATDLLTDAQSALGLTVDDTTQNMLNLTRVSDVLVKANTLANATTLQFSTALTRQAATSMRTFGIEIEQGVAVLAAYADQGIKAELAGTSYDRVLRLLSRSALDNAEAHKMYGLEVFDATGKMNSMVTITRQLEHAFKDMSTEEKVAALEALGFQARVQQAIFPLIGMSDEIERYEQELKNAGGTTEEVANKQLKSFVSQMRMAWNHVKMVGRDIGEILAPKMLFLFDIIKKLTLVWKGLNDSTKSFIINAMLLMGAAVPFIAFFTTLPMWIAGAALALKSFVAGIGIVAGAIGAVAGAIAAFLGPVGGVIVGVGAAIAGVVAGFGALMAFLTGTWSFSEAWEAVSTYVGDTFRKVRGFFKNWESNWPLVKDGLIAFLTDFSNIGQVFQNVWHNVKQFAGLFVESLGAVFGWFRQQGAPMAIIWGVQFLQSMIKVLNKVTIVFTLFAAEVFKVMHRLGVSIAIALSTVFTKIMIMIRNVAIQAIQVAAALANMDFDTAAALATKMAVNVGVGVVASAKDLGNALLQGINDVATPIAMKFMEGFAQGATTDDLQQTLKDIWAGSDFRNALEGTALDPDSFVTVDRDVTEFVGPLQPADMMPGFVGPQVPAWLRDDFVGPPRPPEEEAKQDKKDNNMFIATKEIEATTRSSAKGSLAMINARLAATAERKRIAKEEADERKRENEERTRQREQERAEQEAKAQELWGYMRTITTWIEQQSGAVFANFGG